MSCDSAATVLQAGWLGLTAVALYFLRCWQLSTVQVRAMAELSKVGSKVLECALEFEKEKMRLRTARQAPAPAAIKSAAGAN